MAPEIEQDSVVKNILFVIVQCTWGLCATLIGLVIFLKHIRCPHRWYRGAVETRWISRYSGLNMGLFIFTPNGAPEHAKKVRVHEYGHCMQSVVLGPLMLIVGIISVIWGSHPYFVALRKEKHIRYTACFVESWASRWGELVTGETAIWD